MRKAGNMGVDKPSANTPKVEKLLRNASARRPGAAPAQSPVAVYLARLATGSRRTMAQALRAMAQILSAGRARAEGLDWSSLRYQHTQALRSELAARYAPATSTKMLAALRGVLREAFRLGLMGAEDYQRAVDLAPVRAERLPAGRALAPEEVDALLRACVEDPTPAGYRDAALLAVLCSTGLRRSELVALRLGDYDPELGALAVRAGKGRKDRTVYLPPEAEAALSDWLEVRGSEPGALFGPVSRAGRMRLTHMHDQAVLNALRKRAAQAGVERCSPHDLRRTFISELLDAGADIATVQRLAGHASVETTARYDRRGEDAKRDAAHLLRLPYRRPGRPLLIRQRRSRGR